MKRMLDDRAERDAMAQRGRRASAAFWSEEAVVPQYLAVVRAAAARRAKRRIVDVLAADAQRVDPTGTGAPLMH
jgi:hypothetical protein